MVSAAYELIVDWTGDDVFGDANEDITADVLRVEWQMGRDKSSMLTGRSRGGRLLATLDNDTNSGKYNSFNSSSVLYGNMVPGRKVRLRATDATGTVTLWRGFLDRINPQISTGAANTALLEALGPLAWLSRADFDLFLPLDTDQDSGQVMNDLLDAVSWPAGDRDIDTGESTIRRYYFNKSGVLGTRERRVSFTDAAHKVEETENGFLHESKDGKVIFENRDRRLSGTSLDIQVALSDNPGALELSYSNINQDDAQDDIFNLFTTTIQNYTVAAIADIWTNPEAVAGGADVPVIPFGESRTWIATPPVGAAYDIVSIWTTPVATTDYVANSQADGAGSNLTGNVTITNTEKSGLLMTITYTNGHASLDAFLTLQKARGQALNFSNPVLVLAQDPVSQGKYGIRRYPIPAELVRDSEEGQDHVDWLNAIYSNLRPQIEVQIEANLDAKHLDHVLRRDISERVSLEANSGATNLGLVDHNFFIESARHVVVPGKYHVCRWGLFTIDQVGASGAGSAWPIWVVAHGKLGINTGLHY